MTSTRERNLALAVAAVVLLTLLFLKAAGMDWFNVLLAATGLSVIALVLVTAIRLQDRADTRAGRENLARIRAVEAERAQQQKDRAAVHSAQAALRRREAREADESFAARWAR